MDDDLEIINVSELEDIPAKYMAMIEGAYRRGYYQGFFSSWWTPENRKSAVFRKLWTWRYKKTRGKMVTPPEQYWPSGKWVG